MACEQAHILSTASESIQQLMPEIFQAAQVSHGLFLEKCYAEIRVEICLSCDASNFGGSIYRC
jgi:hypothetical protein